MITDIDIETERKLIMDEVCGIIGVSKYGWNRNLLDIVFRAPSRRFAKICTTFEYITANDSFQSALKWLITPFVSDIDVSDLDNIPKEGPLLIVSNHPGAYDSVAIASMVPRPDMKVIVSDIGFAKQLPATSSHMVFIADDVGTRMNVIRETIVHLKNGGSILVFPTGLVDPEPAIVPGASKALERWSRSIEIMIKKVPDAQLVITTTSHVLAKAWLKNPITSFQKVDWKRQRLAELFQICQQLILPGSLKTYPKITFGKPVTINELSALSTDSNVMPVIIEKAKMQLEGHIKIYQGFL